MLSASANTLFSPFTERNSGPYSSMIKYQLITLSVLNVWWDGFS
jgi:hypothetical protein